MSSSPAHPKFADAKRWLNAVIGASKIAEATEKQLQQRLQPAREWLGRREGQRFDQSA